MNIGFDAKRITHNATGLGNYGRFIVRVLARYYPNERYFLYTPSAGKETLRSSMEKLDSVTFRFPGKMYIKWLKSVWRSFFLLADLQKNGIKVFHGLSNELPYGLQKRNIRSVVTIHDLIFLRYPEFYKPIDRLIYTYKFKRACRKADRIIAVSEMTKKDIIRFFGTDPSKIDVVYQGCDPAFLQTVTEQKKKEVRKTYQLPERYILCVGSIERRKNQLLAMQALRSINDPEITLVVIGKQTAYCNEIKQYIQEHHLTERVFLKNDISHSDLPAVYQMATLFVYPSFFEGFGIPIIEALHSGIPVIAATGSCLEEAGGPASLYIDPKNEKELAEKIEHLLNNPECRKHMVEEGKKYVVRFSDEQIAVEIMRIYRELQEEAIPKY